MARVSRPETGYITDLTSPAPAGDGVAGWTAWAEQLLNALMQVIGVDPPKSVTLSSDSFAPELAGVYVIGAEGAAATDTLSTISTTGVADGQQIQLRAKSASEVITVQHGTSGAGQIVLADAANLVLSDTTQVITLEYRLATTRWHEVSRQYGNAKSSFRTYWGLAIGSAVQAFHANLAALAGLTGAADKLAYFTGAGAMALATFTSFGRQIAAVADLAAAKTLLEITDGVVVSTFYKEYTANANLTVAIPQDDTVPEITEGTEIMSDTVTTTSDTQKVRARFQGAGGRGSAGQVTAAIFRGSTCIGTATVNVGVNPIPLCIEVEDAPGAAATYTYSVRVGGNTTVRLNGSSSARFYGGSMRSTFAGEVIEP